MTAASVTLTTPQLEPRSWRPSPGFIGVVGSVLVLVLCRLVFAGKWNLALGRSDLTSLHLHLNDARDWVDANRNSNVVFLYFFNEIQVLITDVGTFFTHVLSQTDSGLGIPEIGWLGLVVLLTFVAYAVANVQMAALTLVVFTFIGLQGLWADTTSTLALVVSAVLFSLIIGLPLGIWAGTSDRFDRFVTPILDFMQILPSFCYLAPLVLVFSIGPASAIVATIIYAVPPVIRIASHGIRQVPATTREAVDSLGTSRFQRLRSVLLPMARRTIVIGINQTVMAALSMVIIASLIGAPGLGLVVSQALQSLDVGGAFNAGLAIVLMAITFDRVTTAASVRSEKAARAGTDRRRLRLITVGAGAVITVVAVYLSRTYLWAAQYPSNWPDVGANIKTGVGDATTWVQNHLSATTNGLRDNFSRIFLNPFENLLTATPFFVVALVLLVIAMVAGGWRIALTVAVCLGFMVWFGVWQDAMSTLAATIIATIVTMILGVIVGVWMGRSKVADRIIRPVLDAGQTMPAFVYLVPFLGLFGPSRFTAIVAGVVYAAPASIKIIADGISQVSPTTVEAATASGSTRWQIITKVQLPMSAKALALATNQGLIYVLSMVVIGALVGAGALGYDVIAGLNQQDLFGKGLAAGLTLVVMGIILDRITQAAARRSVGAVDTSAVPAKNPVAVG